MTNIVSTRFILFDFFGQDTIFQPKKNNKKEEMIHRQKSRITKAGKNC